jgi:HSP20 family protein
MNNLARFAPLRDALRLQDEFNRLFDGGRAFQLQRESLDAGWVPPVDIFEDAEGITLRAELPGLTAEDIDIRLENGTLTLRGERKLEQEERKDGYHRIERFYGTFSRSFSLPPTVDAEKARAESKNGVLSVFLPKREETKPKQIKVKVEA